MKIDGIKRYIELYDTENYLFKVIGPAVRKRGYFLFDEFYKICMWKSARQKQRYIENKDSIEKISWAVFEEKDETKKMEFLCKLKGVSIPTASALLSVVYPEKYAVIDIRCLETLKEMDYKIGNYPSAKTWIKYVKTMRDLAIENAVTPREMDMALFAIHRDNLDKLGHRNLYKS